MEVVLPAKPGNVGLLDMSRPSLAIWNEAGHGYDSFLKKSR